MFDTNNKHLLNKNAIKLVLKSLPGSIDMDAVAGYYTPYDVEWENMKIIVRIARPSKKSDQKRAKWFYSLREKDHQVADYFILFAITGKDVGAVYVLPKIVVPSVYITITRINGNIRYDYFRTDPGNIAKKLYEVQRNLPKLVLLHREAKVLKGSE